MRKPTFWFPTWPDTNHAVQLQKMARGLKFRIHEVGVLYYLCSENKGADQLRGHREADLRLCFRIMPNVGFLLTRLKSSISLACFRKCTYQHVILSQLNHLNFTHNCLNPRRKECVNYTFKPAMVITFSPFKSFTLSVNNFFCCHLFHLILYQLDSQAS